MCSFLAGECSFSKHSTVRHVHKLCTAGNWFTEQTARVQVKKSYYYNYKIEKSWCPKTERKTRVLLDFKDFSLIDPDTDSIICLVHLEVRTRNTSCGI